MKRTIALALILFLFSTLPALASSDEIEDIKARIGKLEKESDAKDDAQDKKMDDFESRIDMFDQDIKKRFIGFREVGFGGMLFSLDGTFIIQGAHNANSALTNRDNVTDPTFSMDFILDKDFEDINGRGFFHMEAGKGLGVEEDIVAYSNVNRDVDNELRIRPTELYYEQILFKQRFVVQFGLLDPTILFDENLAANDELRNYIGRMFRNSPTIDFPGNSIALRLVLRPFNWIDIVYMVVNANPDWQDIFSNLFNSGEITLKPFDDEHRGNYRILAWTNNYNYTRWTTGATGKAAFGFGVSADQKIFKNLTLFGRYGWQNEGVFSPGIVDSDGLPYSLDQAWSLGANIDGAWWSREDDEIGLAFGQVFPSDDFINANAGFSKRSELHLETYYKLALNKHIALTPDFQFIHNAFGGNSGRPNNDMYVFGLRTQLDF